MKLTQKGSVHLIAFIVIALVIGVGVFAGYRISQLNNDEQSATVTAGELTSEQQAQVAETPALNEANTALDEVANDLDSDLDVSTLDDDIDALY